MTLTQNPHNRNVDSQSDVPVYLINFCIFFLFLLLFSSFCDLGESMAMSGIYGLRNSLSESNSSLSNSSMNGSCIGTFAGTTPTGSSPEDSSIQLSASLTSNPFSHITSVSLSSNGSLNTPIKNFDNLQVLLWLFLVAIQIQYALYPMNSIKMSSIAYVYVGWNSNVLWRLQTYVSCYVRHSCDKCILHSVCQLCFFWQKFIWIFFSSSRSFFLLLQFTSIQLYTAIFLCNCTRTRRAIEEKREREGYDSVVVVIVGKHVLPFSCDAIDRSVSTAATLMWASDEMCIYV